MSIPTSLPWWEYEELREHCLSRTDIWDVVDDLLFRKSEKTHAVLAVDGITILDYRVPDEDMCYCIQAMPITGSRFRMTPLTLTLGAWSQEDAERHFLHILRGFTSYGTRMELEAFFRDELKIAQPEQAAIIASYITLIGLEERPTKDETFGPAESPGYERGWTPSSQDIGTVALASWPHSPQGSVRLWEHGGLVRTEVTFSVEHRGPNGGTSHLGLTGFLRPFNTTAGNLAQDLFGPVFRKETECVPSASTSTESPSSLEVSSMPDSLPSSSTSTATDSMDGRE